MKRIAILIFIITILIVPGTVIATTPYQNYLYDHNGVAQQEPQAVLPVDLITGRSLGISNFKNPQDVFTAPDGMIYIADTDNNRIVVIDSEFKLSRIISDFINIENDDILDNFSSPTGVFVNRDNDIYIADSKNERVVLLNCDGTLKRTFSKPETPLLSDSDPFVPVKVAADMAQRLYIVVNNLEKGIVHIESDGTFVGFFGAVKTPPNIINTIVRLAGTAEMKKSITQSIPTVYSNIDIDVDDFVYGTVGSLDLSKYSIDAMAVHKMNPAGTDILKRYGNVPVYGDGAYYDEKNTLMAPYIVDIAVDNKGIYSILDRRTGRVFSYDDNGNMIYNFGVIASNFEHRMGQLGLPVALDYLSNGNIVVVDSKYNQLVVYQATEYGEIITELVHKYTVNDYQDAYIYWQKALKYTSKSELLYNYIGQFYFKQKRFLDAMKYFKLGENRAMYSKAYQYQRKDYMSGNFNRFILIFIVSVIFVIVLRKIYKKKRKKNEPGSKIKQISEIIRERFKFALFVIFHPFKGFWDLMREKMGKPLVATVILILLIITYILRRQATGFIFNYNVIYQMNLMIQITSILIPFLLWCVANWSITTLVDGEGSLKYIYIASAYAMVPIILINVPMLVLSQFITMNEGSIYYLLDSISLIWSGILLLFGIMTIHQFTLKKTVVTIAAAVLTMAVMVFLFMLFLAVISQMVNFVILIYSELSFR